MPTELNHAKSGGFDAAAHGRYPAPASGGCPDVSEFKLEADAMHQKWRAYALSIKWEDYCKALAARAFEIRSNVKAGHVRSHMNLQNLCSNIIHLLSSTAWVLSVRLMPGILSTIC